MPRIRLSAAALAAILAAGTALGTGPAFAACASDGEIAAYLSDWRAGLPTKALGAGGSMADALCTQGRLVAALAPELGGIIGHKAGLTSPAAQERFGVAEPVRGVLLRNMLLENGAAVPLAFGARPLFEADLILVVGDAAINEATDIPGALAHLAAIRPFLELPDLAVAEGEPITGVTLTAGNVGARLGVLGAPLVVAEAQAAGVDLVAALAEMTVRVEDASGATIAEAKGASVLGHPVNSLLWLMRQGVVLAPGDMVSVGSIGPLMPPAKAGGAARVVYAGLPGDPTVSVSFVESAAAVEVSPLPVARFAQPGETIRVPIPRPAPAADDRSLLERQADQIVTEGSAAIDATARQGSEIGSQIADDAAAAVDQAGKDLKSTGEAVEGAVRQLLE
ncbi:hypothetical protein LNKW23_06470 [Paralimibaculum aggregatum]|uniref:2-keto-4-pentenoate hydratase n=1 Tax=Paralimibaculum aggregatum TaxID=3036245 RepID=A0ABQ6LL96_9RHOB|nr:hypothetical protein LNKW23_06470 [Limibaculum sp. NKW23]